MIHHDSPSNPDFTDGFGDGYDHHLSGQGVRNSKRAEDFGDGLPYGDGSGDGKSYNPTDNTHDFPTITIIGYNIIKFK